MEGLFIGIAEYILKHPECRNKRGYEIYNSYFAAHPYTPKTIGDVKLILEYINRIKNLPENLLLDAMRGRKSA